MSSFHLQIVSPDGMFYDGDAYQVSVRTLEGEVAIRAKHMPYVTAIGAGECRVYKEQSDDPRRAACIGGFLTVSKDMVLLAATTFEWAEDIDVDRANKAKEKAERILASDNSDIHSIDIAKIKLTRALTRTKVYTGYKR